LKENEREREGEKNRVELKKRAFMKEFFEKKNIKLRNESI
jgi:hypothetical protein